MYAAVMFEDHGLDEFKLTLPEDLQSYITAFDKHSDLKPKTFEISDIKPFKDTFICHRLTLTTS